MGFIMMRYLNFGGKFFYREMEWNLFFERGMEWNGTMVFSVEWNGI